VGDSTLLLQKGWWWKNCRNGERPRESIPEQLERENLFVVQLETGRERIWYRYNPCLLNRFNRSPASV
jgi:ATP/maltotriose-dependent transcriptional regulator MalT